MRGNKVICDDMFGFRTKKIWVLKVREVDLKDVKNLYRQVNSEEVTRLRKGFLDSILYYRYKSNKKSENQLNNQELEYWMKRLSQMIKNAKEDYWEDVVFIIRDKCKKPIGFVETISEDGISVKVGIWIPNEYKKSEFLDEVKEAMVEWCLDEEKYVTIKQMSIMDGMGFFTTSLIDGIISAS